MLLPFYLPAPSGSPTLTLTPGDIAAVAAAVLAALMSGGPIPVNVKQVNDVPIRGTGTPGDTWGPV